MKKAYSVATDTASAAVGGGLRSELEAVEAGVGYSVVGDVLTAHNFSAGNEAAIDAAVAAHTGATPAAGPATYVWCEVSPGVIALCDSDGVEVTDKNVRLLTETELVGEGKKVIRASPDGSRFYSKMLDDGTKEEGAEV